MFHVYMPNGKDFWTNSFKDKRISKNPTLKMGKLTWPSDILRVKAYGFEGFRMAVHFEWV